MQLRAVFVDMDGTLLGNGQVAVSVPNMRAVQAAIRKGVHVICCTGRVYDMLPPQVLTQEGLRYFVTAHGARAYDAVEDRTLYEDLIPCDEASAILKITEGKGLYNEIAADKTIFLEKAVTEPLDLSLVPLHHLWYVRDERYTAVESPAAYFLENRLGVEKMNLYNIPASLQEDIYEKITATGFIIHTRPGAGANLEFSHRTLSKLRATDAVLAQLGVSYAECMAIGDSASDVEIIQKCGLGVAMGNAPDGVKAAADAVTAPNTEDGLAKAFEKYLL